MKLSVLALLLIVTNSAIAQFPCWTDYIYSINFDDGNCMEGLFIDSISNTNTIWEIGAPQKNTFLNAFTDPNVIITDKQNPYPINDTSSFIISHLAGAGFYYNHTVTISGYYNVNSDSLNDYGLIELSPDNGISWYDIINDPSFAIGWNAPIPTLTGNSNGWNYFYFNTLSFASMLGIVPGDTIKYRFTFVSDGNFDNLDGLMFDSFELYDYVEGIEEIDFYKIQSKTFPNPATNTITIEFDNPHQTAFELKVIDIAGKEMLTQSTQGGDSIVLDLSNLEVGIYTYILRSCENQSWSNGKIIKAD